MEENIVEFKEENRAENSSFKPFVKASDRAENYKSSAYSLFLVGGLGIVFLFLCLTNIIHISIPENIRVVGFIGMLTMFLIFIFVGVKSLIEAKTINAMASDEENLSNDIRQFFRENYDKDSIDKLAFKDEVILLRDEMKFFKREEIIRKLMLDRFGQLDQAFLDNEIEFLYNSIFEE